MERTARLRKSLSSPPRSPAMQVRSKFFDELFAKGNGNTRLNFIFLER